MNLNHTGYSYYTKSVYDLILMGFDFGLKDYPIFNEEYRPILNEAILNYYKFKEIGFTNPMVFKDRLNYRMSVIMRNKYNALYIAKAKDFNPLYTLDVYDEYKHEVENTGNSTNNGTIDYTTNNTNKTTSNNTSVVTTNETNKQKAEISAVTSAYPSEEMVESDFDTVNYIDGGSRNKTSQDTTDESSQNSTSNGTVNNSIDGTDKTINVNNGTSNNKTIETYSKHSYGSASDLSFAHAMVQFKDYCDKYNLDQQVISELSDLFHNVW